MVRIENPGVLMRQTYKLTSYNRSIQHLHLLSGEPDYFGRKKISSGGDLSHYSSASLY